jgi:uncharacterized cofD-like protein
MIDPRIRVLVADPKPAFSHDLAALLAPEEHQVVWTKSPGAVLNQLSQGGVDVILLDEGMLADRAGLLERLVQAGRPPVIILIEGWPLERMAQAFEQGVDSLVVKPCHPRELVLTLHALQRRARRIVCLGGGTGLYSLLLGLKTLPGVQLTSVVSMSDDGGSSGRLREDFGVLPPGDVRRSLVALSTAPSLLNDLMNYRFQAGDGLKDHNLGNLLLLAMDRLKGSMAEAVRSMGDILGISGIVLPVTTQVNTLHARLEDGRVIRGESHIDVPSGEGQATARIVELWQEPAPDANPNALAAILSADLIVLGPGDLFTSVIPNLTVKGIREAIAQSAGRRLYVCNLMTKPGETSGFDAIDHVREVVRYLGQDVLDGVLVANTRFSASAIERYERNGQVPVRLTDPDGLHGVTRARLHLCDVGSEHELVRHDSMKLAGEVSRLLSRLPDRRKLKLGSLL